MEIVAAAVGVELAEQPVLVDHLSQRAKARDRALFLDDKAGVDRAGRIVEGDHKIEIMTQRRDPAVCRAVLEQQHSGQRSTLRRLRWAQRRLALVTSPAACSDSLVTV